MAETSEMVERVADILLDRMVAESDDPLLDGNKPIGDDLGAIFDRLNDLRDQAVSQARSMPKSGCA